MDGKGAAAWQLVLDEAQKILNDPVCDERLKRLALEYAEKARAALGQSENQAEETPPPATNSL